MMDSTSQTFDWIAGDAADTTITVRVWESGRVEVHLDSTDEHLGGMEALSEHGSARRWVEDRFMDLELAPEFNQRDIDLDTISHFGRLATDLFPFSDGASRDDKRTTREQRLAWSLEHTACKEAAERYNVDITGKPIVCR